VRADAHKLSDEFSGKNESKASVYTFGCFPSLGIALIPTFMKQAELNERTRTAVFSVKVGRSAGMIDMRLSKRHTHSAEIL
jgi:hypothetical protein